MKILLIIQARLGSTRLPGKILRPLAGKPLLERQIERIGTARIPFHMTVATTTDPADEPIRMLCADLGIDCFSGDPLDLLDRHHCCALEREADVVVKIPSDCPLIDPAVIDAVLGEFLREYPRYDYVSNLHPATYPDGNDIEVMTFPALTTAWKNAVKNFEREHTTPYLWERPEEFFIGNVAMPGGRNLSMTHRWTIDYEEDYRFIACVYDELWRPDRPVFTMEDILKLLDDHPEIAHINAHRAGVNWYSHHLGELRTITADQTRIPNES